MRVVNNMEYDDNEHFKMFFLLEDRKTKINVAKLFWEKGGLHSHYFVD